MEIHLKLTTECGKYFWMQLGTFLMFISFSIVPLELFNFQFILFIAHSNPRFSVVNIAIQKKTRGVKVYD